MVLAPQGGVYAGWGLRDPRAPSGCEALQGPSCSLRRAPPVETRALNSLVPVLRPSDCFHNSPQEFASEQCQPKSVQIFFVCPNGEAMFHLPDVAIHPPEATDLRRPPIHVKTEPSHFGAQDLETMQGTMAQGGVSGPRSPSCPRNPFSSLDCLIAGWKWKEL